ncbi:MAG: SDR family oxidoreductase [Sphingomonadales bacterium]|nr:SDR family oxidoreductase [Sphingomonadales bacterium]
MSARAEGRLAGKVALVTGGGQGLGEAICERFCQEGADVHIADLSAERGEALAARLSAAGGTARFHRLDVTDEASWIATLEAITAAAGRLDVLVNNAGIAFKIMPIHERPVAEWDQLMAVNARGVFLGVHHAIPIMLRGGGGSIVNLSSAAALGQWEQMEAAYAASKAAVRVLSKSVGTQYAARGIRCNSLHPGPIETDMVKAVLAADPGVLERRLERVPMRRLGRPAEVAAAVLFLASDESSYITAAELAIDGGAVAQ